MKILVLNGSPKGRDSITLQTALYLEKLHPEHDFAFLEPGRKIRAFEKDFSPARQALEQAELILFVYPVYTFLAPYQLHRFIELIKKDGVDLKGKYASQITTSKHFYDVTAHKYIEENCLDLGMRVIRGLSADMEDLLSEKGRKEASDYWKQLMFSVENDVWERRRAQPQISVPAYRKGIQETDKTESYDVAIVTSEGPGEENLHGMIEDFRAALPCKTRVINLREFPFAGGCLGCLGCAVTGKCVYKDGFDDYLRNEIQTADAIVYAFAIQDHFAHSSMKNYDDRQFCNGHRTVTAGMPVAYLISGNYSREYNLQTLVEARSQVGGNYLAGVATDESGDPGEVERLAKSLCFALENRSSRPQNFWGVGGTKIFRDLIYVMQGFMKADHRFYKAHGIYDFPQKQRGTILKMKLAGALLSLPSVQKKMKGRLGDMIVAPYRKVIEEAQPEKTP